MAALRIRKPAGPGEPRRRNLSSSSAQLGPDLIGFRSSLVPVGVGYVGDHRHIGSAVVTCRRFFVDNGRRKRCPRAILKNGSVSSLEVDGSRESTLCISVPSETPSCSRVPSVSGQKIAQGIDGTPRASVETKKEGKLWRRLGGGKKLERRRAPKRGPGKDRHDRKSVVKDDVNAVLSCITQESTIQECNSTLIHLEKHSDEKALNFFDWMKANGKLKGNADAYL